MRLTAADDDTPDGFALLDPLSTTQTIRQVIDGAKVSERAKQDAQIEVEAAAHYRLEMCENRAPYIFFIDGSGRGRLVQGCCNNWQCSRCGHLRALHEYGRMVNGAKALSAEGYQLHFLTLTCRGSDCSLADADANYYAWCNRLLTTCRTQATRSGQPWHYGMVTERQQRGHPHSHLITTYRPKDAVEVKKGTRLANGTRAKRKTLDSAWLVGACQAAGLGRMVDMTLVREPVAVAVYMAKYMFKTAMATTWPKGWRRVRYSRSWPRLPERKPEIAFPLVHFSDWLRMEALGIVVHCDSAATLDAARARRITCTRFIQSVS